jgi:hypothetical protein
VAAHDGYYLVKISGFTRTQAQIDALTRAGAVLGEYLNVNTYIAKIPSTSYAAVKSLPSSRSSGTTNRPTRSALASGWKTSRCPRRSIGDGAAQSLGVRSHAA